MTLNRRERVWLAVFSMAFLTKCESINPDVDLATLSGPRGFAIRGATGGDYSGQSVSNIVDVNGDAIDDIVVGAYSADPTVGTTWRGDAGIVYVIFGRSAADGPSSYADILLSTFNTAGTPLGFAIFGAADYDHCGQTVSTAGDVNGDGLADILLGSPGINPVVGSVTRTAAGVTYVVFGRNKALGPSSYSNVDLATFTAGATTQGFRIIGAASGAQSAYSLAGGGNVNSDGFTDIVVGAYGSSPSVGGVTRANAGVAYVIFGRATFTNIDLASFATGGSSVGFSIIGAVSNDQSGLAVGLPGDINNDGIGDILVATYMASPILNGVTRTNAGTTYVIFGRVAGYSDIDLLQFQSTGTVFGFAILGASSGATSGCSVSIAGEVNGDGVLDIVVGSPGATPPMNAGQRGNAGVTYVIFGRDATNGASAYANIDLLQFSSGGSTLGYAIFGEMLSDNSGYSVKGVGDMNGDGISDIITGAYRADPVVGSTTRTDAGGAYVVYGRSIARGAASYSNIDLANVQYYGYRIQGVATGDRVGWSVSGAGDVNKDGLRDVIVSAYMANNAAGISYVIFGAIATPTSQPSSQPSRQPSAQPSSQPVSRPTTQPSGQPSHLPSYQPSSQPSSIPTRQPSCQPSTRPSAQPTGRPSGQPSAQPQGFPSSRPSTQPSSQPSSAPTEAPTAQPSMQPSSRPSAQPTHLPTLQPSGQPSSQPTSQPSRQPQANPTSVPSRVPSAQPTQQPSCQPSSRPSESPSTQPSGQPSSQPSPQSTSVPTTRPSVQPSARPSHQPTSSPSQQPTSTPSAQPTSPPSSQPSARPSVLPTVQPSTRPSTQPSSQPSTQPTAAPSTPPSRQPSAQPSAVPSCRPSSQPTQQPTSRPTCIPSSLPTSVPSAHPTSGPSGVPSRQPVGLPTSQPSVQPSSRPTVQPSTQPRAAPTCQPTTVPTARPSGAPTGEWSTVATAYGQQEVFYAGELWVCGMRADGVGSVCSVANAVGGAITALFTFQWSEVTSVFTTGGASVLILGKNTNYARTATDVSRCNVVEMQVECTVVSYLDTTYQAVVYVPYPKKFVYVGWCNVFTCISIQDASTGKVQSYLYTSYNIKALTLTHLQSPPAFVGAFVVGTAVRATASPVNYIVAGMVRTEAGIFGGMALMPQSGDIVSNVDLVTAMALEITGPDSFIVGGLQLDDGAGAHAYLLRANALFMSIAYCARYRSAVGGRRQLSDVVYITHSVVRGVVLVDTSVYMIVDYTSENTTSAVVLKVSASNGGIVKQVQLSSHNGTSVQCGSIASAPPLLVILCNIEYNTSRPQSVLLSVDYDLSFEALPRGIVRSDESMLELETVPFKRTVLSFTKADTTIATSTYAFVTADEGPTLHPSPAPITNPTAQPSSTPSSQPSSSPTSAPSVSARPTSQPSSATPTNTHKPSTEPTVVPTNLPSTILTARPTPNPTVTPSKSPSVTPTVTPTVVPSIKPTTMPTGKPRVLPTARPTRSPTLAATLAPSALATVEETPSDADSGRSGMPSYVVGASVGGGLGLLLLGYVWYTYVKHKEEERAKDLRRVDYYAKQTKLVAEAHAEMDRFLQREAAIATEKKEQKRQKELQRERKTQQAHYRGRGAYATGPVQQIQQLHTPLHDPDSSADTNISELHSSEMGSQELDQEEFESWESEGEDEILESELGSSDFSAFAEEMMCEMENDSFHTGDSNV